MDDNAGFSTLFPGWVTSAERYWVTSGEQRSEYQHQVVDHAIEYVKGHVHTNGLENFWSLLKRTLKGTYVSVEPFHLFRYLDEQAFRYNERKHEHGDLGRFKQVVKGCTGRRLSYREVTGKENRIGE